MKSIRHIVPRFFKRLKANITFNIIAGILILLIVFSIISTVIGYWQFSERFTEEYKESAFRIAQAAETYVYPDMFREYLKIRDFEENVEPYSVAEGLEAETDDTYDIIDIRQEYLEGYINLQMLCDKVNAEFIYVIVPDTTDYEHIQFVYNIVNTNSKFDPYPIGYIKETTNDEYKEKYRKLMEGVSKEECVVRDKGYIESGSHITAMIALPGEDSVLGILCVQRQMDALSTSRVEYTIKVFIALLVMILLVVIIYGTMLGRSLIRPIKMITAETERFSMNPSLPDKALSEGIKSHDEIGVLARSVDAMESETMSYIDNLTFVTAEQQRIGTELDLASKIQQSMLNDDFPEHEAFELFATMDPAKEVGGDFYDFFMIDDDHMGVLIADVSGKGVPAAMFMTISKIIITDTALTVGSPAEILRLVNERICKSNKLDMFVTVWLGILELSTGKLTAANAGHEYPVICRKGGRFDLFKDRHGLVIGGMRGIKYRDYEIMLEPGDTLFVYTDGLPEATDSEEELFGVERMIKALNIAPEAAPADLLAQVRKQVDDFVGEAPQFDDLTMLCLRYRGVNNDDPDNDK